MSITGDTSFYTNKICLAPMVRAGRTPLRVLALEYGADLVYTEEIIDQKLLSSKRTVNNVLDTIDYCMVDDVVLRISRAREQKSCVLQIGTNSGNNAAEVAKMVGTDVAAIDVNMGCPKPFSIHCGMGSALLTKVDKIREILTSLTSVAQVPVSCKIRVLDDPTETLNLVREIEKCGVAALGVHGRRRDERDPHPCRIDEIREVARTVSIPVIANGGSGEIKSYEDILDFRKETGTSSVMVARQALSCPSVFRRDGTLPFDRDIENFLDLACEFDENYTMTKYVVQRILGGKQESDERGRQTVLAGSNLEICRAWGREDKYEECRRTRLRKQCKRQEKTSIKIVYLRSFFPAIGLKQSIVAGQVTFSELRSAAIRFSDGFRPNMWPSVRWTAYAYFKRLFLNWVGFPALKYVEDDWKGMHGDALNDIIDVVNRGAKPLTQEEHASIQARTEDWAALNLALEERRQARPGYVKKEEPVDSDDE
ncbi:unnamed protein product [Cylicocyclus nassatus]|uniref:DUS-like FMN-binding domain-containing protein n=1 Tax=Cylicocyclus nassatus TaxID=53992 RepID=A0AA36GQ63_CYLNA|nr:unnamed protein product [Cylicocyclus nassatus]